GCMLDVEKDELHLHVLVCQRFAILVTDLSPTSDSWTYNIAHRVVRNLFGEPLDEFGALRPRADKPHVTLQHAPELRNFIQPRTAQEPPNARDARIIVGRPGCPRVGFRVLPHGTELEAEKCGPAQTDPLLPI